VCGIAGVIALSDGCSPIVIEDLRRMVGAIEHRGPDELGAYVDGRAALGHARLSIIDLATGQQPLANEDRMLWVVFNGEIFNYVELREELLALGHQFRTRSDTEVIVHAYEAWGADAFARFNGQFAICLWDRRNRTAVFARDRLGVRPLYLCQHEGRLFFASEVKAIFAADPGVPRAFDPVGLAETFTFWSIVPPQSVFTGITELRPGHVMIVADGNPPVDRPFWQPRYPNADDPGFRGSLPEAVEAVRAALQRATDLRMLRADVTVGSYLSGGLDSSLVATLGRSAARGRLETFSLRFEDAEFDETDFQREMVAHLGSQHHELVVRRRDIAEAFPEVIRHTERPILRTAPAPLYLLSRLVRQSGIKVVLTGEGADEMFAGYDLFREAKVRRFWARQPSSQLRPLLLDRLYPYLARSPVSQRAMARQFFGRRLELAGAPGFAHDTRWQTTAALARLFSADQRARASDTDVVARLLATLPSEFPSWSPLAQDQYLEVRTLLGGYLLSSQGDRMLMAHSVEGRFPFLDREVVELANSLPAEYKLRVLDEKHVLKRVADGVIPARIIRRPKQPYRAPDAACFVAAGAPDWIGEVLSPRAVSEAGVFAPDAVASLWRKCSKRGQAGELSNTDNMALVGVLSTQLVHHLLLRPSAPPSPSGLRWKTLITPEKGSPHA
jgi:asparagine synthase (glutamine-hydrolysing)